MTSWGPDVDYILDGAFELLDITPDAYVWMKEVHPPLDYDAIMDGRYPAVEHPDRQMPVPGCMPLFETLFARWWACAPTTQKAAITHAVLVDGALAEQVRFAAETAADRLTDRYISGTLGLPDDAVDTARFCTLTRSGPAFDDLALVRPLTAREREGFLDTLERDLPAGVAAWADKTRAVSERLAGVIDETGRAFVQLAARGRDEIRDMYRAAHWIDLENDRTAELRRLGRGGCLPKAEEKVARKVLRRSAAMMDRIVGAGSTRVFFSRESLTFTGERYAFEVRKRADLDLLRQASSPDCYHAVPYELTLRRASDGLYLARGCLVFDGTPALEQITALFMMIKSGREDDVVRTTNWYDVCTGFHGLVPEAKRHTVSPRRLLVDEEAEGATPEERARRLLVDMQRALKRVATEVLRDRLVANLHPAVVPIVVRSASPLVAAAPETDLEDLLADAEDLVAALPAPEDVPSGPRL